MRDVRAHGDSDGLVEAIAAELLDQPVLLETILDRILELLERKLDPRRGELAVESTSVIGSAQITIHDTGRSPSASRRTRAAK